MRFPRGICAILVLVPLVTAGCTGGSGSKHTSSSSQIGSTPTTAVTQTTAPATTTTSTRSSPVSAKGTVPVDQIPPGHPSRWVPAGMPTTAKYKEPGDFLPMFTPALLKNDAYAPGGMVGFVVSTLNWSEAAGAFPEVLAVVCQSELCHSTAAVLRAQAAAGQHVVGARVSILSTTTRRAAAGSAASWIVRAHLQTDAGKVVNRSGLIVRRIVPDSISVDFYAEWTGRIWHITRDALVALK
jgi:hypothetical protein